MKRAWPWLGLCYERETIKTRRASNVQDSKPKTNSSLGTNEWKKAERKDCTTSSCGNIRNMRVKHWGSHFFYYVRLSAMHRALCVAMGSRANENLCCWWCAEGGALSERVAKNIQHCCSNESEEVECKVQWGRLQWMAEKINCSHVPIFWGKVYGTRDREMRLLRNEDLKTDDDDVDEGGGSGREQKNVQEREINFFQILEIASTFSQFKFFSSFFSHLLVNEDEVERQNSGTVKLFKALEIIWRLEFEFFQCSLAISFSAGWKHNGTMRESLRVTGEGVE